MLQKLMIMVLALGCPSLDAEVLEERISAGFDIKKMIFQIKSSSFWLMDGAMVNG